MTALYNENDPFATNWLESLITHGHIAPGRVDRRSIADLTPADVTGPGQRHFFAGIGGWSHALRLAGIPDTADVWTGSCPCQPFSDAGQGQGVLDPRHLWPAWFALIEECRPPIIFGEQVASKDGLGWLDVVFADLERCGYTVGAADLCAAGVGAPHARQRLYFVAYADRVPRGLLVRPREPRDANAQAGRSGEDRSVADAAGQRWHGVPGDLPPWTEQPYPAGGGTDSGMANPGGQGLEVQRVEHARRERQAPERGGAAEPLANTRRARPRNGRATGGHDPGERGQGATDPARSGGAGGMADAARGRRRQGRQAKGGDRPRSADHGKRGDTRGILGHASGAGGGRDPGGVPGAQAKDQGGGYAHRRVCDLAIPAGATGGFWAGADWVLCRDPTGGPPVARPVEPGTFPLAHGVPGRVGLLRGSGNAIVPQVAAAFIRSALDALADILP